MLEKVNWYVNRLRCMSLGEVAYRIKNKYVAELESRTLGVRKSVPSPDLSVQSHAWFVGEEKVLAESYVSRADRYLSGIFKIFSLGSVQLGKAPNWNKDPKTGTEAPLVFGKTLNYRDEALVGDIKYLWEPNRHLHLVVLCQAYKLTRQERYLLGFKQHLGSWLEQCPCMIGPNWTSSLELGIRLINWSLCWQLIGGVSSPLFENTEGQNFMRRWIDSVYQHCKFIQGHWSRYSSANNHLIGEAAGLYIASLTWPFWKVTARWGNAAKAILEEEVLKQTHSDGVNREQAISYQHFVLDFLIMSGLAGKAAGSYFSDNYWNTIERMLEYLASIMDRSGNVPMFGDADDGYVVSLSCEEEFCPYKSLLTTGAILFDRSDFMVKAERIDDKTRWMLGDAGRQQFPDSVPGQLPVSRSFPNGGYYILGVDFETEREIRMIVDAGPMGYLAIAAHGHADALAMVLSVGGKEMLIDTGTYAYHTQKKWRDYFRGTSAHNTVRIDELDQSVSGGNFMWIRHADVKDVNFTENAGVIEFSASHNGYRRLRDPVEHKRWIRFEPNKREFIVRDTISCNGTHAVERWWHFAENCEIEEVGDGIKVTNEGQTILMRFQSLNPGQQSIYRASDNPVAGWISRSFDQKRPTTSLVERFNVSGTTDLVAHIKCK